MGIRTSDEPLFVGGQGAFARPAPANIRLQEEGGYRHHTSGERFRRRKSLEE